MNSDKLALCFLFSTLALGLLLMFFLLGRTYLLGG